MHFGLYLKGGGAKGAFQAGLLCAFWQRGVSYSVIAGTSIGAINGWYVLHDAYQELQQIYTDMDKIFRDHKISGKVLDNSMLIERLKEIKGPRNPDIQSFYVNYVKVENGRLKEMVEDVGRKDAAYALERIGWSAQLPYNQAAMTFEEYVQFAAENDLKACFTKDLSEGLYEGIHLDGGLVNNQIIPEIFNHQSELVITLGYNGTREEYRKDLEGLSAAQREKILYLASAGGFQTEDTFKFTPEFLKTRFQEGYQKGMDYPLVRLMNY